MQIFSTITDITKIYNNVVVALGTFDGVHLGHQNIIKKAVALAKDIQGTCVVFTFSNHPMEVLSPEKVPPYISDNEIKALDIESLGVDVLMNVPFTMEFAGLTPVQFIHLLKDHLNPHYIVVGPNYSFGCKGEGTPQFLQKKGTEFGIHSEIQPAVHFEHHIVSSTRIRNLLQSGNLLAVNALLGRNFRIHGAVVHGDERGRVLGFPTANMKIAAEQAMLPTGIYACYAIVEGQKYKAVTNIGTNPTFNGHVLHMEVHILDFHGDLYEKDLQVEFCQKIRDEEKFSGVDALVAQIKKDIETAKTVL